MVDGSLVGRCGLYCGACSIYRAYIDGGEPRKTLAEKFKITEDKVRCNGCSALTPECWGTGCKIVKCLDDKGYKFCYECDSFKDRTCEKYEKIAVGYLERGEDMRKNLERIESGDTVAWLLEQDMRWRCPSCGHPISVWWKKCTACGKTL